jgi:hypothetical protein
LNGWADTLPSTSVAQRRLFAIAEHKPNELYKKNRGLLKLSKKQLHEFADTKEFGLPARKKESNG